MIKIKLHELFVLTPDRKGLQPNKPLCLESNSVLGSHNTRSLPHLVHFQMLSTVLNIIIFEDCRNQWSMSRPLLGLILLNEKVREPAPRGPDQKQGRPTFGCHFLRHCEKHF